MPTLALLLLVKLMVEMSDDELPSGISTGRETTRQRLPYSYHMERLHLHAVENHKKLQLDNDSYQNQQ